MATKIVSENYFKYDPSDYAKSLRTIYGEDGYKKYTAKMNSIMTGEENLTNPIKASKEKYIFAKKVAYQQALAKLGKSENIWNDYKASYSANLAKARQENNGYSLTSAQKRTALANSGDGATTAYKNFTQAQSNVDEALSLYFDATHSGMAVNMLG